MLAILVVGVVAGVSGALLTLLLHLTQHAVFGVVGTSFAQEVREAPPLRRLLGMAVAGGVVGVAWWQLRRRFDVVTVRTALADPPARLPLRSTTLDAVTQIVAVGAGASLGREGAPRQLAAALAEVISARLGLDAQHRRVLLGCAAGAGLAALYNAPVAGGLFTVEIVLATVDYVAISAAGLSSCIAVVVAWPVVGRSAIYQLGTHTTAPGVWLWAVLAGPICTVAGRGFVRLMDVARRGGPQRPTRVLPLHVTGAMAVVGAVAMVLPGVTGNGKSVLEALVGRGGLSAGVLVALLIAKPLVTALCLRGGLVGGLITPSMATGGSLGALVAVLLGHTQGGVTMIVCAMVGAAAMLATTQRAPVMAGAFMLEISQSPPALWAPVAIAVCGVWLTNRWWPARK
ncbi:chloride channel protein [Flexivirga oryzae]|uniref:H+/Cl- antiporter ClcA n=1 Tax=Flexivirga oryzae TaxID=1794944 RepID=A0A839N856_9MICO|nr:H+/Cl- antiporter ClcA [Flexivirga oryzae]